MSILRFGQLLLLAAVLFTSCTKDLPAPLTDVVQEEYSDVRAAIDQEILETVRTSGKAFNWKNADHDFFWKALQTTNGLVTVGYDLNARSGAKTDILGLIQQRTPAGSPAYVASAQGDKLGFVQIYIRNRATLETIREMPGVTFTEPADYHFNMRLLMESDPSLRESVPQENDAQQQPSMVLDPQSATPYPDQVAAYDGGLRTVLRRHNMEAAYTDFNTFGDGIGVTIIDNGLLPDRQDFFYNNGYGERHQAGYYNFWWFLPWTQPDGVRPKPTDVFGLSYLIYDTYYIHGSEMVKQVLTLSPNADITATRGSTWTVIVTPDQANGIADAIMAAADDPGIRMASMSMGTIIHFNQIELAIQYFDAQGKMFVCSAGSTFAETADLLGVLFPGYLPESVVATAIKNRETTGGEFIITEGSHGGPENDFTVENTNSSSVACSRTAGMISLIWSANPSLTKEELMQVLIESSYFYQLQGSKHEKFGWGTIDVSLAVELAIAG